MKYENFSYYSLVEFDHFTFTVFARTLPSQGNNYRKIHAQALGPGVIKNLKIKTRISRSLSANC